MEDDPKDVFEQPVTTIADDAKTKRRERLLANLKKGRETALTNRKKKAMFKKAKKQEHEDEMDKVINIYREIQERADKRKVKQAELGSSPQAEKKSKGAVSTED